MDDLDFIAAMQLGLPPIKVPDPLQCKCSFRQRLVGDGCDQCNPELAAELAEIEASEGICAQESDRD